MINFVVETAQFPEPFLCSCRLYGTFYNHQHDPNDL